MSLFRKYFKGKKRKEVRVAQRRLRKSTNRANKEFGRIAIAKSFGSKGSSKIGYY